MRPSPNRQGPARRRPRPRRDDGPTARLFAAIHPPGPVLAHLAETVDRLHTTRAGARLTARERWHLTLVFLGEVAESRLPAVADALSAAAAAAAPFPLAIAGGGRFGRGRFTVLWAGLGPDPGSTATGQEGPADQAGQTGLVALARSVRRQLRRSRLPFDDKPFRPHLTLARPGDRLPDDLIAADVATLADYRGPQWTVDRLSLVRSYLGPQPRHEPLGSWPLSTR